LLPSPLRWFANNSIAALDERRTENSGGEQKKSPAGSEAKEKVRYEPSDRPNPDWLLASQILAAFMGLARIPVRGLRMSVRFLRIFQPFGVVALAMMFGSSAVGLRCILVCFGCASMMFL
jgi:hypothetical protein